jgi:type IV pilus assembly protein PilE
MKENGGFTLIEMLVTITIIGVLASVAIPSYNIQIERVRASEAVQVLTALLSAQNRYQLENGAYAGGAGTTDLTPLDITIPASNNFNIPSIIGNAAELAKVVRSDNSYTLCINSTGVVTCNGTAGVCSQYTAGACP